MSNNNRHIHSYNTKENILSTPYETPSNETNETPSTKNNIESNHEINLCTAYCDKDFLLSEEIPLPTHNIMNCPEISIQIGNITVLTLLDTGASISCMSEKFYENNKHKFSNLETFPLSNTNLKTAVGQKSKQLKKIIYTDIKIKQMKYTVQFIIVPSLIREIIIGVDILQQTKAWIDFSRQNILIFKDKETKTCKNFMEYIEQEIIKGTQENPINPHVPKCLCYTKHFEPIPFENTTENTNHINFIQPHQNYHKTKTTESNHPNHNEINDKINQIVSKLDNLNAEL